MKSIQGSVIKRALMVTLLAGSGALAAASFAMSGAGPTGNGGCEARMAARMSNMDAKRDAYLASLKQKLNLQPAQEAAWNAFTSASQFGAGNQRLDRKAMRDEMQKLSTPERLDKMQAMAEQRQARMLERSKAIKAFYAQLTPEQQSVFDAARMLKGPHGHRHGHGQRPS